MNSNTKFTSEMTHVPTLTNNSDTFEILPANLPEVGGKNKRVGQNDQKQVNDCLAKLLLTSNPVGVMDPKAHLKDLKKFKNC